MVLHPSRSARSRPRHAPGLELRLVPEDPDRGPERPVQNSHQNRKDRSGWLRPGDVYLNVMLAQDRREANSKESPKESPQASRDSSARRHGTRPTAPATGPAPAESPGAGGAGACVPGPGPSGEGTGPS